MRNFSHQGGFTLIELMVVIAIIGIIMGIIAVNVNSARVSGRDAKRLGDVRQMATSFEQYYVQNGVYPTGSASIRSSGSGALLSDPAAMDTAQESMVPNYVPFLPISPDPADGNCGTASGSGNNNYWYEVEDDGSSYTLTFCLGKGTDTLGPGAHFLTPNGIN